MNFKRKNWLVLLMILSFGICVNGQKNRTVKGKKVAPPLPEVSEKKSAEKLIGSANYVAIVEVDEFSKIKIVFEDPYFLENYSDKTGWVENLFANLNQKKSAKKTNLTEIIVRPSAALSFSEVSDVIKKIRNSSNQNIKVDISENISAIISKPLAQNVKPNPLFLLVNIEENGKISLNNEPQGSVNDLTQLRNYLERIFNERLDNGTFREGSNEVETTVFIAASPSVKFLEVIKTAQVLKEARAIPIGLQIDEFVRTANIEPIN